MPDSKRLLLLSVGYGQGHHSAAAALAEHYAANGWDTRVVDVCAEAQPRLFRLTQRFYSFCVRRAPWLWGITYSLTDTADWAAMVRRPTLSRVVRYLADFLQEYKPDLVICTYPLFAYMLDFLRNETTQKVPPYAIVVTDALEISRPWMRSETDLIIVPDAESRRMVIDRYALDPTSVIDAGFPVRRSFMQGIGRVRPDNNQLRVLYGAYRQTGGVINDIAALLGAFPQIKLTVIAGNRAPELRLCFASACSARRLEILEATERMPELLAESHFYIGKAGAATMFECYAANVPVLINFTLPGQERGNLELLLMDDAGRHAESTAHLIATMEGLLHGDSAGWCALCHSMMTAGRSGAASAIARVISDKFGV